MSALSLSFALPIALGLTAIGLTIIMGLFTRTNHFPVSGRTVVITGGSQGMGRAVARLLAAKGANVVIVARNVDKLKTAVEYVGAPASRPGQRIHYISADMTDPSESIRVLHETKIWNHNRPPDVVWCIAGSAYPELFVNIGVEGLRNQMDQNYWSAAYMAQAALKEWLQPRESTSWQEEDGNLLPGPRHLIFTSSVAAFYSMVGYTPYAPAKAALRSLSDGLAQEVQLYSGARRHDANKGPVTDVKIHTVFPGTIFSPGYEQENLTKPAITKKLEEDDKGQTEEEVAAVSVRGLERGEYLVTTSFLGSLMRSCSWGGSPRNSWFLDTPLSWIMDIAWLVVQRDLDGKVFKWGQKYGYPKPRA